MRIEFFFEKLYKEKFFLYLILGVFFLSILACFYFSLVFIPVYFVETTKVDGVPEKYFSYNKLDQYAIQQIFNHDQYLIISSEVFSEILEIQNNFETNNVEYSNEYYQLHLSIGRFSPIPLFFFSFTFSGIFIAGIIVVRIKSIITKE